MNNRLFLSIIVALVLICASPAVHAVQVTYVPDNQTVFKNPERGFTEELSYAVSEAHPNVIKGSMDDNWGKKYYMTLAVILYNYKRYKAQDLPDYILNAFDEDMQVLRDKGIKCVLRFAYTESESDNVDATPDWVKRHLEQLKPHLEANKDVIYVLEAGFVGVWGEWYYTANYGNESQHMNSKRRQVIDYLYANVPQDMFVLFRYPMIKTEYLNDNKPLTAEEGFSGSVKARMGCHNDAFLNNYGNHGTYASDEESDDPLVRDYVSQETLYVPNGGETNVESSSRAEKVYKDAPLEMGIYHWSFCGSSYATAVTKRWRESGIFDTLNIHMGYRYNLLDGQFSDQAAPGGKMNITFRLANDGYAPIYNERPVYIVLYDAKSKKTEQIKLAADPRRWRPNGVVRAVNEQIAIPDNLPEGTYHLYLYLPDNHAAIQTDPRFAVRIANAGIWNEATGWNDLDADVQISAQAPADPGTLPDIPAESNEGVVSRDKALQPHKVLQNGRLYIELNNGQRYTAIGQMIQ
jgi:hypothetical protein